MKYLIILLKIVMLSLSKCIEVISFYGFDKFSLAKSLRSSSSSIISPDKDKGKSETQRDEQECEEHQERERDQRQK